MSAAVPLAHADAAITAGSKSFAAAARLFDPATRRSAVLLYAWCRHCDDVIDGQVLGHGALLSRTSAADRLARLEDLTRRALAGEPMAEPAFQALQAVATAHAIPDHLPFDHLAGFRLDVEERTYRTLDDLLVYCYGVAGVVGLMMAHVMGVRGGTPEGDDTLHRACDLGLAFQLTNIARDLVEDAAAGRCYLPLAWLEEAGVPRREVAATRHRPALARLAARLVAAAEPYYASAEVGVGRLPYRSAWAVATALRVYRQIGTKVVAAGPDAWVGRISTSKADKLGHVAAGAAMALAARRLKRRPRDPALWTRPA
ncbi:phytoene/squalene synthase family protein [Chthonobacter rhizosphaerae]|uniref:phytoene/squalene synthase family protein n=1 Tax=Chthonobacter rhizosphaerae TaxID=2735553 RepID=UPI0015EF1AF0|nr:phytoene/squalene synthase family protein [Chthonobacter rhizosphaerae]